MLSPSRVAVMVLGGATVLSVATGAARAEPAVTDLLQLEAKIPLGDVRGRIDHMVIDQARNRLFVAELGNNSVGIVDLNDRKVVHLIAGLKEPQGVAYLPAIDT